ncbi:MAG TPA: hypothetical protein VKT31_01590, partial [Solirubrobacteraceae bacterium]|nr:hypothetical protein [Solirubrobacteraceae bacterium]
MPPRPTALRAALLVCVLFALALTSSAWAARHHPRHHHLHPRTTRSGCADPDHFPATRNPANPLMLPVAPGANPLNGAHFFVNGAHNGAAAGVILRLLGMDPHTFPASYSWARLSSALQRGGLHARLAHNPALAHQVALMSKVASQPEEQRWSLYSAGGGPGKVY